MKRFRSGHQTKIDFLDGCRGRQFVLSNFNLHDAQYKVSAKLKKSRLDFQNGGHYELRFKNILDIQDGRQF